MNKSAKSKSRSVYYKRKDVRFENIFNGNHCLQGGLIFSFNRENPQDKKVYESMVYFSSRDDLISCILEGDALFRADRISADVLRKQNACMPPKRILQSSLQIGLIIENPLNKDAKKKDPLMFRGYYTQEYRDQGMSTI